MNATLSKILGVVAWLVISILFGSLLSSWAMSKLWTWFVAAQYGAGPTMGTWFGAAAIGRVALWRHPEKKKDDDDDAWEQFKESALRDVGHWLGLLLGLGVAWCTGAALGWLP